MVLRSPSYPSPIYMGSGVEARLRSSEPDPQVGFRRGHLFYADFDGLSFVFLHKPSDPESGYSRYACMSMRLNGGGLVPYACLADVSEEDIANFVHHAKFVSATWPVVDRLLVLRTGLMKLYVCTSRDNVPSCQDISSCLNVFDESRRSGFERWMLSSVARFRHGLNESRALILGNVREDGAASAVDELLVYDYLFRFSRDG